VRNSYENSTQDNRYAFPARIWGISYTICPSLIFLGIRDVGILPLCPPVGWVNRCCLLYLDGNKFMKMVKQTKFGEDGNCFIACLASILGTNIDIIPDADMGQWWIAINKWLLLNYGLFLISTTTVPNNFYGSIVIADGVSPRSCNKKHAVLWRDGKILFDPHPSNRGVLEVEKFYLLVKYIKYVVPEGKRDDDGTIIHSCMERKNILGEQCYQ